MVNFMYFFFFSSRRRHTRYWRDWSSDVCSSDLCGTCRRRPHVQRRHVPHVEQEEQREPAHEVIDRERAAAPEAVAEPARADGTDRSEERRVGKECRARGWADHRNEKRGGENEAA